VLLEPIPGASVLAVVYLGLLGASFAILSRRPDLTTRTGRHLVAGALGIAALAVVEVLIDARFGPAHTRVATLLPQGIAVLFGLILVILSLARHFERRT